MGVLGEGGSSWDRNDQLICSAHGYFQLLTVMPDRFDGNVNDYSIQMSVLLFG